MLEGEITLVRSSLEKLEKWSFMLESSGLGLTIEPAECLRLVSKAPIGRVIFTDQALPAVQPVNFLLDGDSVIFRTGAGSKLASAARNSVVAFEVDEIDPGQHRGWSVTLIGHAEIVTDQEDRDRLIRLPLRGWRADEDNHLVRIRIEVIRGRRIGPSPPQTEPADGPDPIAPD
ncbi:MAG TPA: pyridoxamine 5'-phosphate oxidase family protein [Actinopolymorphaceae bacterium]